MVPSPDDATASATRSALTLTGQLGPLPDGFEIEWPDPPQTDRAVSASSTAEAQRMIDAGRIAVELSGNIGNLRIRSDDVHIIADDAQVGRIVVEEGTQRVHIEGGRLLSVHTRPSSREADMVSDVLIERAHIEGDRMAVAFRGVRLAVVDSTLLADEYAVFGAHRRAPYGSDIIIARNLGVSLTGREATVRLTGFDRTATVDNVLSNPIKHNYRIHGSSRNNLAQGNTLIHTGSMIGTMPPDDVGPQWVIGNTFYHERNSLLQFEPQQVEHVIATDNVAYSARRCFACPAASDWTVHDNAILSPTPPPAELTAHDL